MWKKVAVGVVAAAALAAGGLFGYMELVKAGYLRYNKYDRRERGRLQVGDQAPDLELARHGGGTVRLSSLWARKPLVLVFGSCT